MLELTHADSPMIARVPGGALLRTCPTYAAMSDLDGSLSAPVRHSGCSANPGADIGGKCMCPVGSCAHCPYMWNLHGV